jgi:hypothetical protein
MIRVTSRYLTETVPFTGRRLVTDPDTGLPATDRYGNDVYEDVPFTVDRCAWEPRESTSKESNDGEQHVESGLNLYCADPAVDVRATDKATIDGLLYEVVGRPARFTGSRMGNDHAHIVLKRVTG